MNMFFKLSKNKLMSSCLDKQAISRTLRDNTKMDILLIID